MARLLYTLLLYLSTPIVLGRLLWRSRRAPAYARRWGERFGFVPALVSEQALIWVHAVSVGETIAAVPMVKALQEKYPHAELLITTTTPTGSEHVRKVFGPEMHHVYAPYDLPDVLNRFFARVNPSILIIMETELWPNLIRKCRIESIPVVVANARLSEKSAAGYKKIAKLSKGMLSEISLIAAQTDADAGRFIELGVSRAAIEVTGNIKFDLELDQALHDKAAELKAQWQAAGSRPVWLAASTHEGEDELVLDAFALLLKQVPETLLVLVPRHPERFDNVASLCLERGFKLARRSDRGEIGPDMQILLGDTMGELLTFCGASDIAFVGGSLVAVGGHNLIEPAAWGVPILTGPYLFNFAEVASKLDDAGAMEICENAEQLGVGLIRLLSDTPEYQQEYRLMANAARRIAESNRGALMKLTMRLEQLLD